MTDPDKSLDVLPGTLDLLILKTLALEPQHGWGIGQRIQQTSRVFQMKLGSLYPALQRLEQAGLIQAQWRQSDNNRRARYYRLTRLGQKRLQIEISAWQRLAAGVTRIVEST